MGPVIGEVLAVGFWGCVACLGGFGVWVWWCEREWRRDEEWAAQRLMGLVPVERLKELDAQWFEDWFALPAAPDPTWLVD